jgi:hypothetical protein
MSQKSQKIKRGQLISWDSFSGKSCGIVLETFFWKLFDDKTQEGVYVLSKGEVYKIYETSTMKIIKSVESLLND